ncbi:MAG TPA: hypothetical protein VNJ08_16685 [Bacteriovoracaceae bacterium]|nr:hypothetical protein [Bacteriovoracaceae bacterium]
MRISIRIVSSFLILGLLASACGKKSGGSKAGPNNQAESNGPTDEEIARIPTDGSNIEGHYLATFTTLNGQVNGVIPGSASFVRKNDKQLFIYLRLFAGGPSVWHQQKVYTGTRCPTLTDDKNGDGYIDILEAEAVLGNVLIPLDTDPSNQMNGSRFYPLGDLSGSYHYERVISFKKFFDDLKDDDKIPTDNIVKLAADEPLILEGKTVLIQGTSPTVVYPLTVGSSARYKPFQTLPIVCGVFKKVITPPGVPDDGVIPGPVADVEEGQDRPSTDEPIPTTGGAAAGTTGGSNDSDRDEDETSDEDGNRHTTGGSGGTSGGTTGSTSGGGTTGSTSGGGTTGSTSGGETTGSTSGGSTTGSSTGNSGGGTTGDPA